jgi:hypothetical protein
LKNTGEKTSKKLTRNSESLTEVNKEDDLDGWELTTVIRRMTDGR